MELEQIRKGKVIPDNVDIVEVEEIRKGKVISDNVDNVDIVEVEKIKKGKVTQTMLTGDGRCKGHSDPR